MRTIRHKIILLNPIIKIVLAIICTVLMVASINRMMELHSGVEESTVTQTKSVKVKKVENKVKASEPAEEALVINYDSYGLSEHEIKINTNIQNIKDNNNLSMDDKLCEIAQLLYEESDIKYDYGSNLFNWNNELMDDDFKQPGFYYKDGMKMDCSTFIQYLVWIATLEDKDSTTPRNPYNGILLGRNTYFQTIEGISVDEPHRGTICYRYNGGSGVERKGEELLVNETPTSKGNHVAIYLGDGCFIDCSESYGGIRYTTPETNSAAMDFYTWYRDIPKDYYVSQLEIEYHNNIE